MWFIRPKFRKRYNVFSDIFIDSTGIHDGNRVYPWQDIKACSIDMSDPKELEWYFGKDFHEKPFSIFITLNNGTRRSIFLLGLNLENAVRTGMAINHYSGRELIPKKFIDGEPIPWSVIFGILALAALLVAVSLYLR